MTGPIVQDALSPNLIAVGEEMHPRDVAADPLCEVFAVFKELPSSLAPLQPPFIGLVERERIGRYPLRIFADLIRPTYTHIRAFDPPRSHRVSFSTLQRQRRGRLRISATVRWSRDAPQPARNLVGPGGPGGIFQLRRTSLLDGIVARVLSG
ncbi:MAG: hypothetical protein ABIU05_28070 [Nitrospirales bacterium]